MAYRIGDLSATSAVASTDLFEKEVTAFAASNKITAADLQTALATPFTDNVTPLGSASKRWSDVRAMAATFYGAVTVTTGGLTVTVGGLVVTAGGLTVTAGGLTVSASGITVTGNSTITGTLGGVTSYGFGTAGTWSSAAATLQRSSTLGVVLQGSAGSSYDFTLQTANGSTSGLLMTSAGNLTTGAALTVTNALTVSAGGAAITGNSTVTGTLNANVAASNKLIQATPDGGTGTEPKLWIRNSAGTTVFSVDNGALSATTGTFSGNASVGGVTDPSAGLWVHPTLGGEGYLGLDATPTFNSTATNNYASFVQLNTAASAITITNAYGFYVADPNKGAGSTITNQYGIYVANQTKGGTLNYALYTNTGLIHFGDDLSIGSSKFTVAAASGNTVVAGTLNVTGAATLASGTITANAPALSLTQTWNNAGVTFTALKMVVTNTASAAASLLVDVQTAAFGTVFSVDNGGAVLCSGLTSTDNATFEKAVTAPLLYMNTAGTTFSADAGTIRFSSAANPADSGDGALWYNGSNLLFKLGGVTKTLSWT